MDPLSLGRSCYKDKNYEAALAAFTEAVKVSTGHILLTALDHRAATLEKLDRLQPALNDAREMIHQKPELAKGYLRCAKILQIKGEGSLALKIYERGLRKVKVGVDADRPLLQKMFQKLQQKRIPSKTFDPMVMLPSELAQMVCEQLAMRDRVICLAVSKPWKRFLEASHDLWTVLDVRSAKRFFRLDSLKAHLRRSNYKLDKAILNLQPRIFSCKNLELLARLSKSLSHLEMSYTGPIADSLLLALPRAQYLRVLIVRDADLLLPVVVTALSYCPQLQKAEFSLVSAPLSPTYPTWTHLETLKSLRLEFDNSSGLDSMNLNRLILCTPNLHSVALVHRGYPEFLPGLRDYIDFTPWSSLEHLEYIRNHFLTLPLFPQSLRYLDLSQIGTWSPLFSVSDESRTMIELPLLETFITPKLSLFPRMISFIEPSVKAGHLTSLTIDTDSVDEIFSVLPDGFSIPSLNALSIDKVQGCEADLVQLLRMCPQIRYLDASNTRITGVAVKELMTRETPPEWIIANGCVELSPDAVEWARSMGAQVQYNKEHTKRSYRGTWRDRVKTWGETL